MRPPRQVTKKRNRNRQDLRRDLVHSTGDVFEDCVLTTSCSDFTESNIYSVWRAGYMDHLTRPVSVPRSLRHIHGRVICPPPLAASPASSVAVADSAVLPSSVES